MKSNKLEGYTIVPIKIEHTPIKGMLVRDLIAAYEGCNIHYETGNRYGAGVPPQPHRR